MRICVLVVDDEAPILSIVMRLFTHKWTITVCSSGDDAMKLGEGPFEFDAIVLDLVMPGGPTGIEIFEHWQAVAPARCERVIFYTGGGTRPSIAEALEAYGRPVLIKPLNADALEKAIEEVASKTGSRGPQ